MLFQNSMSILETRCKSSEKRSNFVCMKLHYLFDENDDSDVFQVINDLEIFEIVIVLKLFSSNRVRFRIFCINDALSSSIKSISCFFRAKCRLATNKNILVYMSDTEQMTDLRINYLNNSDQTQIAIRHHYNRKRYVHL